MAAKNQMPALQVYLKAFASAVVLLAPIWIGPKASGESGPHPPPEISRSDGVLPLHFEPNHGQAAAGVLFLAESGGARLFIHPNAAVSLQLYIRAQIKGHSVVC